MKAHLLKGRKKGRGVSRSGRRRIDSYERCWELLGRRKWLSGYSYWKGGVN